MPAATRQPAGAPTVQPGAGRGGEGAQPAPSLWHTGPRRPHWPIHLRSDTLVSPLPGPMPTLRASFLVTLAVGDTHSLSDPLYSL